MKHLGPHPGEGGVRAEPLGGTMSIKNRRSELQPSRADDEVFSDEHSPAEEEHHPRGTLALLMIFLVVLMTFWGYMYTLLLLRG
jgi:hypothetical protein